MKVEGSSFLSLLLFLLSVTYVYAQQPSDGVIGQWAGTTVGGSIFYPPSPSSPNNCTSVPDARTYVTFSTLYSAAGLHQVLVVAEPSFKGYVTVLLYNGTFNPTVPCSNFVRYLKNQNYLQEGVGVVDEPVFFAAGRNYTFVVTATNANTGLFALQIVGSVRSGTTVGALTWNPPSLANGTCAPITSVTQSMSVITWTQTSGGTYDLLAIFEPRDTPSPLVYFAIYEGAFDAATIAANACNGSLFSALRVTAQEPDVSTPALSIPLKAVTYTAVLSNSFEGNWGLQIIPSRIHVATLNGYNQPARSLPCAANTSSTSAAYFAHRLAAADYDLYFVDTYPIPNYMNYVSFPSYAFAYAGPLRRVTPPDPCPGEGTLLGSAPTGSNGPLLIRTTIGQALTFVLSTISGEPLTDPRSAVQLYIFTGVTVGKIAPLATTTTSSITSTGDLTSSTGSSSSTSSTGTSSSTVATGDATAPVLSVFTIYLVVLMLLVN